MESSGKWPGWLKVPTASIGDLLALASVRFDLDRGRYPAGVIEAVAWILETGPGPGTGRSEGPHAREVAWCEMCAAQLHAMEDDDEPPPPLRQVCADLGVPYRPARSGDPEFGLGAWATLRWAMGIEPGPPMRLPMRALDGHLLEEAEIVPTLVAGGWHPADAQAEAAEMVEDSRRLAALVKAKTAIPV
jgi:hypothetical protein